MLSDAIIENLKLFHQNLQLTVCGDKISVNTISTKYFTAMNSISMDRDEPSSLLAVSTNHPLEQFVLLAKGAKGSACAELIKQVLEAPGVHVFGELLEMPNIKEVSSHLLIWIQKLKTR